MTLFLRYNSQIVYRKFRNRVIHTNMVINCTSVFWYKKMNWQNSVLLLICLLMVMSLGSYLHASGQPKTFQKSCISRLYIFIVSFMTSMTFMWSDSTSTLPQPRWWRRTKPLHWARYKTWQCSMWFLIPSQVEWTISRGIKANITRPRGRFSNGSNSGCLMHASRSTHPHYI
jgi:hypothetical protein